MDKYAGGSGSEILFLREHLYSPRVEDYGKIHTEEVQRNRSRCTETKGKEK